MPALLCLHAAAEQLLYLSRSFPSCQHAACLIYVVCLQTVWGLLKQCGTDHYKRRDIVEAPDGVQLILDWKEGPNVPDDVSFQGL